MQVLNEAGAGASMGAGGKSTPKTIALHCTITTTKKNNLNVIECTKLWFLKREKEEKKKKGKKNQMRYTDNQRSSQAVPGADDRGFNSVAVIQTARQTLRPFTLHFLPF